jgi:hypothetical protein
MNATTSLKLYQLLFEFTKDKKITSEMITCLEESIDNKFMSERDILASKNDLAEMEIRIEHRMSDLQKSIYFVGLIQFVAIISSVLTTVNFMLK